MLKKKKKRKNNALKITKILDQEVTVFIYLYICRFLEINEYIYPEVDKILKVIHVSAVRSLGKYGLERS